MVEVEGLLLPRYQNENEMEVSTDSARAEKVAGIFVDRAFLMSSVNVIHQSPGERVNERHSQGES